MANNQPAPSRHKIDSVDVDADGDVLAVRWHDGSTARFQSIWLRANAQDASAVDPVNGQRLDSFASLPGRPSLKLARVAANDAVHLVFDDNDFETHFDAAFLREHQYDRMPSLPRGWFHPKLTLWPAPIDIEAMTYWSYMEDDASFGRWLDGLARFGIARLKDCPRDSGAVNTIAERIGPIRETNYGRYFDVISVPDPINLAFTATALEAHTDNPYRDPVPGLQFLLALKTSIDGGASIAVDGFAAIARLRADDEEAFLLLSEYPANFQFKSRDTWLKASAPVIEISSDGQVVQIRHNNRAMTPSRLPYDITPDWYRANAKLASIINDASAQLRFTLAPGELVVVDNHRVLHGRDGFDPSAGERHLQGCYIEKDSLYSHLALGRQCDA